MDQKLMLGRTCAMFALRKKRTPRSLFGLVMEELAAGALSGRLKISPHCFTTNSEPLLPRRGP